MNITPTAKIHSKLGIAAGAAGLAMFLIFLAALGLFYLETGLGHPIGQGELAGDFGLLRLLILMIVPVPVHLACFVLAAVSLFFPTRKKLFPAIGVVLNLFFGLLSLFPWLYLITASLGRV